MFLLQNDMFSINHDTCLGNILGNIIFVPVNGAEDIAEQPGIFVSRGSSSFVWAHYKNIDW